MICTSVSRSSEKNDSKGRIQSWDNKVASTRACLSQRARSERWVSREEEKEEDNFFERGMLVVCGQMRSRVSLRWSL